MLVWCVFVVGWNLKFYSAWWLKKTDLSFSTSQMLVAILQLAPRTVTILLLFSYLRRYTQSYICPRFYFALYLSRFECIGLLVAIFARALSTTLRTTLMPSINMRYITLEPYGFLPSNKNGFSYAISTEICNWYFLGVHTIIIMIVWVVSRQNTDDWLIIFDHHNIWWLMFSIVICFR